MDQELIKAKHQEIFGEPPELIVYAPGRINLIGEHTDYSEGYVMPMAINKGIMLGISGIKESKVISVYSIDFDKKMTSMYSDLMKSSIDWFNYPLGVVKVLRKHGHDFSGVRISFTGDVPQGAGLSSSAALEISVAFAIQTLYKLEIPGADLAKICQQAEHEVVGVKCGIMDQYISRMAEKDKCLLIDCRTLEYRSVPLSLDSASFVITNSNVPHKLSSSDYNKRVGECMEAVKILSADKPGLFLRDYDIEDYEKNRDLFTSDIRKRVFHVISENQRVLDAEKALTNNELKVFGELMNKSHNSLKIYYEVSSPELDWLTDLARNTEGCYGSRLTGGGFGGSTISLMENSAIDSYKAKLDPYKAKFGYEAEVFISNPMAGAHVIWSA
jgi:galactokinase